MTGLTRLKSLRDQIKDLLPALSEIIDECETFLDHNPTALFYPVSGTNRVQHISQHAVTRYRERTGCANKHDETIALRIGSAIANGEPMELKPKFRAIELLAHGEPATFYRFNGMIYAVENNVCVTCHNGEANRWQPKQP